MSTQERNFSTERLGTLKIGNIDVNGLYLNLNYRHGDICFGKVVKAARECADAHPTIAAALAQNIILHDRQRQEKVQSLAPETLPTTSSGVKSPEIPLPLPSRIREIFVNLAGKAGQIVSSGR
ncbi:MAG: hypothetical protein A2857_00540 [Candidatus Levybacteria bacterium RIFCSPHIGHO2_01_FULL_36_15]|nr:MAG: hypothetical protein A2857_00540 [Candidatus Levybacteria bacterium RIFCSPHIGHO2_01_FULL_36_15]OGH38859.1 MAG: hypothetical protein A2905_05470 [Candidatus Levybacteria bacterium RIFCSPLOWO2_01_FULL_36_10]